MVAATTFEPTGDTAAGDNSALGYTSVLGAILTGQGSTNDVTLVNDADATVLGIATGTTNVDVVGDITAATITADGDTAAGDNATIGYTAAEGLILTGQGSTDDITIKNDADTTIVNVATGSSDIEVSAGNIFFGTADKGIYLGVTSATAANLLDDYEEGTWTPTLDDNGSAITNLSTTTSTGTYTKVGQFVHIQFYMRTRVTSGTGGSSYIYMDGMPFTNSTGNHVSMACVIGPADASSTQVDWNSAGASTMVFSGGNTRALWSAPVDAGAGAPWLLTSQFFNATGDRYIYGAGTYQV